MPSDAISSLSPLFVFGALRSGTTLLRLMLKSHPGIQSPGEADFLFDHVAPAPGGRWRYDREALARDRIFRAKHIALPATEGADLARDLVEAMAALDEGILSLSIHRNAVKMAALFPQAKIVHLLRDPRDVARSSIGMGWAGNSYFGVEHWIGTEAGWDAAAIPEARVLTAHYEILMADLEAELTRICGFSASPSRPGCCAITRTPPMAPRRGHFAEVEDEGLAPGNRPDRGPCGPLLEARGYEPAGAPATLGALERAWLGAGSRLGRWRHNIRRYRLPLFTGRYAARLLGLKGTARKLADRQEAIRIANLQ